jgi:hypothetical protein
MIRPLRKPIDLPTPLNRKMLELAEFHKVIVERRISRMRLDHPIEGF